MHKSRHMQHKSYGFITMSCFTLAIIKLCICAPMYLLTALKQGRWLGMPMGTLYGALWPVSDVRSKSSPIGGLTRSMVFLFSGCYIRDLFLEPVSCPAFKRKRERTARK